MPTLIRNSVSYFIFSRFACLLLLLVSLTSCKSGMFAPKTKNRDFIPEYLFTSKKAKARYYAAYDKTLQLFEVPIQELDIATRYGKAHVIAAGPKDAHPLVLMHGMDASSTMWYPNIKALSENHRVYAIDYIMDAGKSKLQSGVLNNDQVTLFYSDVFDGLKVDSVDVLGTSRGGWIAAWLAMQPGMKVRKLVLMSPAQVLSMVDIKIFPAVMFKLFPSHKKLKKTLSVFAQHPEIIAPEFKEQFYIASKFGNSQAQVTKMMPFSDADLKRLNMPVLFMLGDHDVMNGDKAIAKAKENIPDIRIEKISDAGHFLSTDQSDKVNRIVLDFLN